MKKGLPVKDAKETYYVKMSNPSVMHGPYTYYYKDKILTQGLYDDGKKAGEWKYYYPDGKINFEGLFNNDQKYGKWKYFYKDGNIASVIFYKNGQPDSTWKGYFPDGSLASELNYAGGKKDGKQKYYYSSGNIKTERNFLNGSENGLTTEYFETGGIQISVEYHNGKLMDIAKCLSLDGQPMDCGNLKDGTGIVKKYFYTGKLKSEQSYIQGELSGYAKYFRQNGYLSSEGNYFKGLVTGIWKYYKEDGSLLKESDHGDLKMNSPPIEVHFEGEDPVFQIVETMPCFQNGDRDILEYLANNISYPYEAKKQGIWGMVFISFVVNTIGEVEDIHVIKSIGGGCDEECLRVVKLIPRWSPALQYGFPQKVQFKLPVRFTLK
ncbi:MAG: TonB family protein [Bacteroidetes bacterium]|nr:TonB family protein [Bacteroidota bacterium]